MHNQVRLFDQHLQVLWVDFRIQSIQEGVVNDSGDAIFTVTFQALVYRPLRGEVIDGIVSGVEKVGIEVRVGACKAFIPHTKIPNDIKYSEEAQAFKSDEEATLVIAKDSIVRFKVENVSVKGQEGTSTLSVIGTIAEDFLGLVN